VDSAADGDHQSWTGLVEHFSRMIAAVARAHRLNEADAADVAQETWLRLLENLGDLREPACVGSWLATTARRECLRVLRTSDRQISAGDDIDDYVDTDEPLDTDLVLAERDAELWEAFERLRPSDQKLLRLLMDDTKVSYRQISTELGIPIGSIGPTRARALQRLREELDPDESFNLLAS
jgi:RNA polymerase sigma factor (sigma-70 family)